MWWALPGEAVAPPSPQWPRPWPGWAAPPAVADVRKALAGLGYGPDEIRDVLRDLPSSNDASTLLRDALKVLGARRA